MNRFALIVLVLIAPASYADTSSANGEQRCDELGARCVCSESLTMSGFTYSLDNGSNARHNPNDSTENECGGSEPGFPWYSGKAAWTSTAIPQALDANSLPFKDPSVQRFPRSANVRHKPSGIDVRGSFFSTYARVFVQEAFYPLVYVLRFEFRLLRKWRPEFQTLGVRLRLLLDLGTRGIPTATQKERYLGTRLAREWA